MENSYNWTAEELAILEAKIREYVSMQPYLRGESSMAEDAAVYNESLASKEDFELSLNWRIILITAFSLNITLSIVGNVIVLIVLMFSKRPKTELNVFLINLALADLTMAIFCMPFTFTTIMYGYWIFSTGMCPTVIFMQQVSVMVSVYTLTAIGIDRYYAVLYPLKVRVTTNRSKILFGLIWLVSVLLAIVQTVFARARKVYYGEKMWYFCTEWWPYDSAAIVYEIFMILLTYIIPVITLMFCYIGIGRRLWRRNLPGNADRQRDNTCSASKKKVIKMLILVVVLFILCYLPLHIFIFVARLAPYMFDDNGHQDLMRKVNSIVLWIAMSNSFMNPVIYSFLNDAFRADFNTMFFRCRLRSQRSTIRQGVRKSRSLSSSMLTSTYLSNTRSTSSRLDP
ncbi:QRFP-like peptide receptor [Ptychodera flava]|uniref:QRFP-like peptide receptor n=1 Tax=Ptychodera flava TaxID=63121 RepID=UPI003969D391